MRRTGSEDPRLHVGELIDRLGSRPPAQIGTRLQRAQAAARGIDQNPVKAAAVGAGAPLHRVGHLDAHAACAHPRAGSLQRGGAAGVALDRHHLASVLEQRGEVRRLAAGGGAQVEHALPGDGCEHPRHQHRAPGLRHDRAPLARGRSPARRIRPRATRPSGSPGAGCDGHRQGGSHIGGAAQERVDADRRLGGLVDAPQQLARAFGAQLRPPQPRQPVRHRVQDRRVRGVGVVKLGDDRRALRGPAPQDRVDEARRARSRALGELDGLVDRGIVGDAAEVEQLEEPETERREHRRVKPLQRAAGEPLRPRDQAFGAAGWRRRRARSRTPGRVGPAPWPRPRGLDRRRPPARTPCERLCRRRLVPGRRRGAWPRPAGSSEPAQVVAARHRPPARGLHDDELERSVGGGRAPAPDRPARSLPAGSPPPRHPAAARPSPPGPPVAFRPRARRRRRCAASARGRSARARPRACWDRAAGRRR